MVPKFFVGQNRVMTSIPTILISRQKRVVGLDWTSTRSWFGGEPRLGGLPWPRSKVSGEPLYFLAQIDLEEVVEKAGRTPLPATGSLAYFFGLRGHHMTGAVVHVPSPMPTKPTLHPSDALPVYELHGDMFPDNASDAAPRQFAFWPIDLTVLDVEQGAEDGEKIAAVERHLSRRKFFFTAEEACKSLGEASRPDWWNSAISYANCLRTAIANAPGLVATSRETLDAHRQRTKALRGSNLHVPDGAGVDGRKGDLDDGEQSIIAAEADLARREGDFASLTCLHPVFSGFASKVIAWAEGKDSLAPMSQAEVGQLASCFHLGQKYFGAFTSFYVPPSLLDLADDTILALATANELAYSTLPTPIRDLINEEYRLPIDSWHQMLGKATDLHGCDVAANEGNYLLLRLVYDDMMHWKFGDMGAYQFFMSPQDLAQRNWDAVQLTFECH